MNIIDDFIIKAKRKPKSIVFPESDDPRILQAVDQISSQNIAHPILIGNPDQVLASAKNLNLDLNNIPTISPLDSPDFDRYVSAYIKKRSNVTEKIAQKLLKKPLIFGAMMTAQNDTDGMVAGVSHTTSSVIQAAGLTVGFAEGITNPSSFFIMVIPEFNGQKDHIFIYSDCAVTIKPTPEQLAEIAVISGKNAKQLLDIEPKIALLSFSTKGSASHQDTKAVIKATEIAKAMAPELDIDGELQGDAAIIPKVAEKKVKESSVAGKSNVLIFPDLNSANIAYKLTQYLANAQAVGPFLQGFARPVSDLSRGASVDDIVGVTAVTVVQAQ